MLQTVMGWLAVVFHISGYSYQSSKTLKSKRTSSLSWITFGMNFFGSLLWLLNGILLRKLQPSLTNLFVLTSVAVILFYIVKQNLKWSLIKSLTLLLVLLAITWSLFIMHLCDMYWIKFIGDNPSPELQISIALISSLFTIISFIPQLVKMFKTKDTKHISYMLSICYGISNFLWIIFYGTLFETKIFMVILPIVIAGSISGCIQISIVTLKFLNERKSLQ